MTNRDFWKLKVGDSVYDGYSNCLVTVVKREVCDEVCGFVMSQRSCRDLKTGQKYVQLTVKEDDGRTWFYDSMNRIRVSKLQLVDRFDEAVMAEIERKLKNGFRWL